MKFILKLLLAPLMLVLWIVEWALTLALKASAVVSTFVGNLTLRGESVVPCLHPVYRARSKLIIKPSQVRYVLP